ncbi:hypothetical protein [Paenibacillus alvei]|nr:hypothetical protein [Paenibacillus alvei]MCY7485798.1 hypothetical protein [Paenibacillus alvei]
MDLEDILQSIEESVKKMQKILPTAEEVIKSAAEHFKMVELTYDQVTRK